MLDLLQKATCELCGEELKWWPEDHGSFTPGYIEAVETSPDICIGEFLNETENDLTYSIYCNFCSHEIHVTMDKY
jgi:hypothetical protein